MGLQTIIDAVNVELATIPSTSTAIGLKALAAHGAPRRFVWVPRDAVPNRESVRKKDGITEAIGSLDWPVDVHCWGSDLDDAERMVSALLTAARKVTKNGVELQRVGPSTQAESSVTAHGYLLVASLLVNVQLLAQDLTTLTDREATTVLIHTVAFDPTVSDEEDGAIDVGDQSP